MQYILDQQMRTPCRKIANRKKLLLKLLGEREIITVEETAGELKISDSTVRRLFADLAAENKIIRTHGGAPTGPAFGLVVFLPAGRGRTCRG